MGERWQRARRWGVMVMTVVLVSLPLAGCGGPAPLNTAAVVNGQVITLDQYVQLTRLMFAIDGIQTSLPTWQSFRGRQELGKAQRSSLNLLISSILFKNQAKVLASQNKLGTTIKDLDASIDTQTNSDYTQLIPQYPDLINQGVLTKGTYRYLVEQRAYGNSILLQTSVPIAHTRILTVAKESQAIDLQTQIAGGADWLALAKAQSTDAAKGQGGDIAQLPRGVLDPALDRAIFDQNPTPKPDAIQIVKTAKGYTLVRVIEVKTTLLKDLDATVAVLPGSLKLQTAAINQYVDSLYAQAKIAINIDWCNDPSGKPCGLPRATQA